MSTQLPWTCPLFAMFLISWVYEVVQFLVNSLVIFIWVSLLVWNLTACLHFRWGEFRLLLTYLILEVFDQTSNYYKFSSRIKVPPFLLLYLIPQVPPLLLSPCLNFLLIMIHLLPVDTGSCSREFYHCTNRELLLYGR